MFTRLLTYPTKQAQKLLKNTGNKVCVSFEYLIVRASFGVQKCYSLTESMGLDRSVMFIRLSDSGELG